MTKYLLDVRRKSFRYLELLVYDSEQKRLLRYTDRSFHPYFVTNAKPEGNRFSFDVRGEFRNEADHDFGTVHYRPARRIDPFTGESFECYEVDCDVSWEVPAIADLLRSRVNAWCCEDDVRYENAYMLKKRLSFVRNVPVDLSMSNLRDVLSKYVIDLISDCFTVANLLNVVAFDLETNDEEFGDKHILAVVFNTRSGQLYYDGHKEILPHIRRLDKLRQHAEVEQNIARKVALEKQYAELSSSVMDKRERFILKKFSEVVKSCHVLHGYYSNEFDVPRLLERCEYQLKQVGFDPDIAELQRSFIRRKAGRVMEDGVYSSDEPEWVYDGRNFIHVDWFPLIKKKILQVRDLGNWSLDNVVWELFHFKHTLKERQAHVSDLSFKELEEYSRMDGNAQQQFERMLPFLFLVSSLSNASPSKVGLMSTGRLAEGFIEKFLRLLWGEDCLIPKRVRKQLSSRLKGAAVLDAIGGIWDEVSGMDAKSHYPNVVMHYNLSPETMDCEHDDCPVYEWSELEPMREDPDSPGRYVKDTRKDPDYYQFTYRVRVCKRKKGVLATLVEVLVFLSETVKKHIKQVENDKGKDSPEAQVFNDAYAGLKAFRNTAAYGYTVAPLSRVGDERVGRLILYLARNLTETAGDLLEQNQAKVRQFGVETTVSEMSDKHFKVVFDWKRAFPNSTLTRLDKLDSFRWVNISRRKRVLYGDTDSLFPRGLDDAEVKSIEQRLGIELDVEWRGVLIQRPGAKKKYIVVQTAKHEVKTRGIAHRRKDKPKFVIEWQKRWLDRLEACSTYAEVLDVIEQAKRDVEYVINVGILELPASDFVTGQQLKTYNPDINRPVQRVFKELGETYERTPLKKYRVELGSRVEYIYCCKFTQLKTKKRLDFDAVPAQLFDEKKHAIHYDHYRELFASAAVDITAEEEDYVKRLKRDARRRGVRGRAVVFA